MSEEAEKEKVNEAGWKEMAVTALEYAASAGSLRNVGVICS